MSIQRKIGLQRLTTLPALLTKPHRVEGLPHKDISTSAELGEQNRWKLQYTSLRDLISVSPSMRGSPKVNEVYWCDISQVKLKDSLLKQAARAYLQPTGMQTTPEIDFFARCWKGFTCNTALAAGIRKYFHIQLEACVSFFRRHTSYAFDRLVQRFRPQSSGVLRCSVNQ